MKIAPWKMLRNVRITILAVFFVTTTFIGTTSARDLQIWADYTADGKRTTGYWSIDGTTTPEVFYNREICDDRMRTILIVLQSLSAKVHNIRCE